LKRGCGSCFSLS